MGMEKPAKEPEKPAKETEKPARGPEKSATTKQKAKSPFKSYDEEPGHAATRVDLDEHADTASSASFTLSPQEETERDNAEEREPAVKPAAEVPERVKAK